MIEILMTMLIFAFANAYITQYTLLVKKDSHFGFFPSKSKMVIFPKQEKSNDGFVINIPEHRQPVTPIDYFRRFFGAYTVENDEWTVTNYADVWTCPFCLSFWTSLLWSFAIYQIYQPQLWMIIPIHFAIAFVAQRSIEFYNMAGVTYEGH